MGYNIAQHSEVKHYNVKTNREYKDSIFRTLFSKPENALELYNAIANKNLGKETKLEMVEMENVFLSKLRNDIAFTVDGVLVVIVEHQSTMNKNIPYRMLQ